LRSNWIFSSGSGKAQQLDLLVRVRKGAEADVVNICRAADEFGKS
jgi:hypothetical protein